MLRRELSRGPRLWRAWQPRAARACAAAAAEEGEGRRGRTWRMQELLPRLPVPAVKDTCERYRAAVLPLLSKKARARTEQNIDWFKSSARVAGLQKELHALDAAAPTSWLEGFWDTMYLEQRSPLVVNTSPCFALEEPPFPAYSSAAAAQAERAAALLHAAAAWNQRLRARALEPDAGLCMAQYARLLGTCRIPRRGRDELATAQHARTVAVLRDGRVWSLALEDEQGRLVPRPALQAALQAVLDAPPAAEAPPPLGPLSAGPRDAWADARAALLQADRGNGAALHALGRALLVLSLDRAAPASAAALARQLLHAGPAAEEGANRCYDKLQLVVCANGRAGFNMEHAPVDGHTLLRFATDVAAAAAAPAAPAAAEAEAEAAQAEELRWVVPAAVREAGAASAAAVAALVARTEVAALHFDDFGKAAMKRCKLSPDGFVQMAFQLAYHRAFGATASTYESALTKQFLHGRTETIRSVTAESRAHCAAFSTADAAAAAESAERLRAAVARHVQVSKDAKEGRGVDRHLFVLLQLAKQQQARLPNHDVPELFTDPSYATFCSNVLSTSNCGSDALSLFGFGPVHEDGLGVGYIIKENSLSFTVTSFREPAAAQFAEHLAGALRDQLSVAKEK